MLGVRLESYGSSDFIFPLRLPGNPSFESIDDPVMRIR